MTITLHASADYGFTGQYIAKLVGRAAKVQFNREFCGTKYGKRNECTSYTTDEPGLYETQNVTRKGKTRKYWIVIEVNGKLEEYQTDLDDALAIAKRLEGGESLEEIILAEEDGYTIRTKAEAKKALAADNLEEAVKAIQGILETLPEPLQRKALTELRKRLFPTRTEALGQVEASVPELDDVRELESAS